MKVEFNIYKSFFLNKFFLCIFLFPGLIHGQLPSEKLARKKSKNENRMLALYKNAELKADFSQLPDILINEAGVEYYEQQLKTAKGDRVFEVRVNIADQLLKSGKTEAAIHAFEALLKLDQNNSKHKEGKYSNSSLKSLLALSYLRLGEQENCIINHNSESCIFPIKGKGIYAVKAPTQQAIKLFKEILQENPKDLSVRWLINIAYMSLGEYPASVSNSDYIPLNIFDSTEPSVHFKDVAGKLGISVKALSGSAILDDFDNDNDLDLFVDKEGFEGQCHYFVNNGNGSFTDKTIESGLMGEWGGRIPIQADYNNDGFIDIYNVRGAWLTQENNHLANSLLKNNGDGSFTNVTIESGLLAFEPSSTASWGDYDNDGFVDLFVANESQKKNSVHYCQLYHNNGDGTFTDQTEQTGLSIAGFIKGACWADFNNDGKQDLFVSDLLGNHKLFRNNGLHANGSYSFTDITRVSGVEAPNGGLPVLCFDYNNDGWLDIFAPAYNMKGNIPQAIASEYMGISSNVAYHPKLYKNSKNGTFEDVTEVSGLNRTIYAMGLNSGDIDNDGFPDIYVGTGDLQFGTLFPNLMFKNEGGKSFSDVTAATGTGHIQKGHGISFGDIDNDGDQDIYSVMGGGYSGDIFDNILFENEGNSNHFLYLNLKGTQTNRSAIGARIKVVVSTENGEREIYSTVNSGGSFGASCLRREIGLGKATSINKVEIDWPTSNTKQVFVNLKMDQMYKIVEGVKEIQLETLKKSKSKSILPESEGSHHN